MARMLQTAAVEESRMKIPLIFAADIIHGHRTIFPVPLAEVASFDPISRGEPPKQQRSKPQARA